MALEGRAKNELLFREVNQRIRELTNAYGSEGIDFICECADVGCLQAIAMSSGAYRAVRAAPATFFVAPGHEDLALEVVVRREQDYLVVEKPLPSLAPA